MTYLEAINKVLRRLREDEVTAPNETAYSRLISELVNDANHLVENAWDWTELRSTRPVTLSTGSTIGSITGLSDNYKVLSVYNATKKSLVNLGTEKEYFDSVYINNVARGTPANYLPQGFSDMENTTASFVFYPPSDGSYTLVFDVVDRSNDLVLASSLIRTSGLAVVQLAHAMAVEERGESGGQPAALLYVTANSTLSDAIAYDVARRPTEAVWYDV